MVEEVGISSESNLLSSFVVPLNTGIGPIPISKCLSHMMDKPHKLICPKEEGLLDLT